MKVIEKICKTIPEGARVVLALSGGPDSVFLFYQFLEALKIKPMDLICAHLHHGLREEADKDLEFVKELCAKNSIPIKVQKKDVIQFARQHKMSTEEAGRALRYKMFFDLAGDRGYIALAHHQIDQAETMLIRLMRGTGIDGLGAMRQLDGNLFRPMLHMKKEEIIDYLDIRNIDYCLDKTNFEAVYVRNKVRLELLPLMRTFNPKVEEVMASLSYQCQEAEDCLNQLALKFIEENARPVDGGMRIKIKDFCLEHKAVQSRILRNLFVLVRGDKRNISSQHIDSLLELIQGQTGREIHLPNGYKGRVSYGDFILQEASKNNYRTSLSCQKKLTLGENYFGNWLINGVKKTQEDIQERDNSNFFIYLKDFNDLSVRCRLPGDKVKLPGKGGRKKLKDLFIDRKVDREKRDRWPIVLKEDEIIWIPGLYKRKIVDGEEKIVYEINAREEK